MSLCLNTTAPAEIYTLSLHDALPICRVPRHVGERRTSIGRAENAAAVCREPVRRIVERAAAFSARDRKSTRLNSSHVAISYAVFCLKKKNTAADLNTNSSKTGRSTKE